MRLERNLDDACGDHFTFRDFIECGETWLRCSAAGDEIDNVPAVAETLGGIVDLCRVVLDPVTARFGRPALTYGFASPALTRRIRARICPARDQHSGSERNGRGALICGRRGMAADVRVPGLSARDLARWISENTAFDRLYFYGDERPVHVSVGPEESRAIIQLLPSASGRAVPRRLASLRCTTR